MSSMISLKGLSVKEINKLIPKNPLLITYRGSIAHGMYVPSSDPNSTDDEDLIGYL